MIKEIMNLKTKDEKDEIERQLLTGTLEIDTFSLENLLNLISVAKTNLNSDIEDFLKLEKKDKLNNLYINVIKAKNKKIDELIYKYNDGIIFNKLELKDNKVFFDNITQIKSIKLESDNYKTDFNLSYVIKITTYDGEIINSNIIPYNHNGLFGEYFDLNKNIISSFEITNKDNIYFYSCSFKKNEFKLGNELNLKFDEDYSFENNKLYFSEKVKHEEILVRYLPSFTSYEIEVNKKVRKIELIPLNDKKGIDKNIVKRLVIS